MKKIYSLPLLQGNFFRRNFAVSVCLIFLFCNSFAQTPDTWTQKANFGGTARQYAVGFSIGNKGYLGTGGSNDFWEYDPYGDTWTQKADFGGTARVNAVGFSIGNKGYLGTGNTSSGPVKDFWEYDPTSNNWTQKADFGGGFRYLAVGFSIGSKGYIGTGYISNGMPTNDFWEYDPQTDTWTSKANFGGSARYWATGFSIGNKGYIGTGNDFTLKNDFWEWDQATNIWTQKTNFGGTARMVAVGFSIGKKGYIGTGQDGNFRQDFWEWNQSTDTWTQITNFGGAARQAAIGFSIEDKGYLGTGFTGQLLNDFWEYTPLLDQITTEPITGSFFCAGATVNVSFNTIGVANSGNVFTAQLSDASGNFSSPVNIGSLVSVNEGTISAQIPLSTSTGPAYRIRVVSSNPVAIGSDNGSDLTVNLPPVATASSNGSRCTGDTLSLSSSGGIHYLWSGPNGFTSNLQNPIIPNVSAANAGTYTVTVSDQSWIQKVNFAGTARKYAVGFSIGNKAYLGTGEDGGGNKKDFWEYDPSTDTWTQKADFGGTARVNAVGFSTGNNGYLGTGNTSSGPVKDFWEFNPSSNTWTQKADFGGGFRYLAVGFSIGNKGYIGTGYDGEPKQDFWEYDPLTDTWTSKANFGGSARYFATGFSISNKGYIGIGSDGSLKHDFWEWNQATNTWTQKTNFGGTARQLAVGFSIGSKGYIGTGDDNGNGNFRQDIWEWNQLTDTWTQLINFGGTARQAAIGFSLGDKGYIGTGYNGQSLKDIWQFYPGCSDTATTTVIVNQNPTANAGSDQTVYFGYAPSQCATLTGSATGGTTPYQYSWSNGATTQSTSVCPTITATYTLTVTDASSCVATDEVIVNVIDVRCGKNNKSVLVCHKANTICVPLPQVKGHLSHGDNLGTCASSTRLALNLDSFIIDDESPMALYPNPTTGLFTVEVCKKNVAEEARIEVVNNVGQVVYSKIPFKTDGCIKEIIELKTELPEGIYFLNLIIGEKTETRKLILTK